MLRARRAGQAGPRRSDLPSGTITLFFSDIEGSTRLARDLGERYGAVLAEHRRVLRAAIAAHGGVEVDTQGDAFLVAFARASDAVAMAADAQRALASQPLRVRIGLHTGEPIRTDTGYFGIDLSRGARICASGHGGQVLLSDTTRNLLDQNVAVRDLGAHRLKDFEPQRVFQLLIAGLQSEFPALRATADKPTNLPARLTPVIGRQAEIAAMARLITADGLRLLTLTGPGGVGKTRLALEIGAEILDAFDDGVFFVPFASITDASLVVPTITRALGLSESSSRTAAETLADHLAGRKLALVLDNLEQVAEAGPEIGALLVACPRLVVVVTSRAPLRLAGERASAVPPLDLPTLGHLSNVEALYGNESVALFVARAQAVRADFELTSDNAAAVAEICRRVDGLPLAIELAAARISVLSPQVLLSRMGQRLPLLTGGSRDLLSRQQTLRATLDWSYGLLSEHAQTLLARLGVFVGGCTLDAAEAICDADLDGLGSLVGNSLVRREGDRYLMLETTREYATERLAQLADREQLRLRHAAWYTEFAERGERELRGAEGATAGKWFEAEHDNLRAVLRDAAERGDAEATLRLATSLAPFWYERGHLSEGLAWLNVGLSMGAPAKTRDRARAWNRAGAIAFRYGDLAQARSLWESALRIANDIGEDWIAASVSSNLGTLSLQAGDNVEAARRFEGATAFFSQPGHELDLAILLDHIATLDLLQGRLDSAAEMCGRGLRLAREVANDAQIACTLHTTGMTDLARGDHGAASAAFREGLERARSAGDVAKTVAVIEGFAAVSVARRTWERAACLFGFADAYRTSSGISDPVTRALAQPHLEALRAAVPSVALAEAWRAGASLGLESVLALIREQ
jgi:predicted ATPase/class 3 adenylate cyclase